MTPTKQQASNILLQLYAECHDTHSTMHGVLNSARLAAIWLAQQELHKLALKEEKGAGGKPTPKGEIRNNER